MENYYYKLYNLNISSSIKFNYMLPGDDNMPSNVHIQYGQVPNTLKNYKIKGVRFQVTPGHFLLNVDNIAKYYVEHGKTITIERVLNSDINTIELFLLGSAMGALVQQRGAPIIHGSAIEINRTAIIFTGDSGAGKSTIAAAFMKRGYRVLADDVCVVSLNKEKKPIVFPGCPYLKVWARTIKKLGNNIEQFKKVRPEIDKRRIPLNGSFRETPLTVARLYILNSSNNNELKISDIMGVDKSLAIINNIYRERFLRGLDNNMHSKFLNQCSEIAKRITVKNIVRPCKPFLLDELVELIEQDIKS